MSIRRNRITGDPILFAPDRADRPGAFGPAPETRCPFCPGHERDTPPTILAVGDPWRVRVFENKYPPVAGAEVIVESPDHDAQLATITHLRECLDVYQDRFHAHRDAAYVSLFRNEGVRAGSSVSHVHAQLIPLPFVPPRAERELAGFRNAPRCPLCVREGETSVADGEFFRWVIPHASAMPYQQQIIPRRHVSDYTMLDERELDELAVMLQRAACATTRLAPDWNCLFVSHRDAREAHFYIELLPRVTAIAGLELATGTFVEIIDSATVLYRLLH